MESAATVAALRDAEDDRARKGQVMGAAVAVLSAGLLQVFEATTWAHWAVTALLLTTALTCTASVVVFRKKPLAQGYLVSVGVLMSITTLVGMAYVGGLASAAAVVLCVLVFAYGLGDWRPKGWVVYLTCALGYLVLAGLRLFDLLPKTVVGFEAVSAPVFVALATLVEVILGFTFWLARRSRGATLAAVRRVQRAQALLDEAHEELADAIDAGRRGRLSGTRIDDFAVGELIGRGASGEVYYARDVASRRSVALKVLHASMQGEPHAVERLVREAKACSALQSPHVCKVHTAGLAPDGYPYVAMELLEGNDLASHLRARGTLSPLEVAEIVTQVGQALEVAHAAGIVHRDIKPQNVFRTLRGVYKVLDFGISKTQERSLTRTGHVIGTPRYMSPEQARGTKVDARSDVFALGAIAYRALTGRAAFPGDDPLAVMYRVIKQQPKAPGIGADIDRVLALALAKDRSDRFASARELASAFARAVQGDLPPAERARADALLGRHPWESESAAANVEAAKPWETLTASFV